MKHFLTAAALSLGVCTICPAADKEHKSVTPTAGAGHLTAEQGVESVDDKPHPEVPAEPQWAGQMITIIGVMFASALFIGLIVRAAPPQEPIDDHGHDDHGHDDHGHNSHSAPSHGHH